MLDTDICIYIIRGKSPQLLQKLTQYNPSDISISSITAAELYYGIQKSSSPVQNQQALAQFLLPLIVMDFDYSAALEYGRLRAHLEGMGTPIGALDTLIAAHTLSQGLSLVTNNIKEFSRVPGLVLENWSNS